MTQLSINVAGAEEVRRALENLGIEIPRTTKQYIYTIAQAVIRRMEQYPPELPYQTYIRTGTLGDSWKIAPSTSGYRVSNATPYARYVVGNEYGLEQVWVHAGRWNEFRQVVDEEAEKSPEQLIRDLIDLARRLGL